MAEKSEQLIIAIDGYSSCGKSTLAKLLAKSLNLLFIDTGAMYRAVTFYVIENNLFNEDGEINTAALEAHLPLINVSFDTNSSQNPIILLNGKNIEKEIRTIEVNANVSKVASNSLVRKKLVAEQRKLAQKVDVVLDGRDIGTVVFPHASIKFFLTASPDVRAQRRYDELKQTNAKLIETVEDVKANLIERDYLDTNRSDSPLIKAADAIVIDNTNLSANEQLTLALELVNSNTKSN